METPKGIAIRQEVWGCTTQLTSEIGRTCRGRSLHSWTLMLTAGPTSGLQCSAYQGFPNSSAVKPLHAMQEMQRCGFNPWIRKIPQRRKWQPAPVFLPGKFPGQRSLAGYSPWSLKIVRHNLATKQQQQGQIQVSCKLSPLYVNRCPLYILVFYKPM